METSNTLIATRLRASGSDLIVEELHLRQYQNLQDLEHILLSLISGPLLPLPVPIWEEQYRIRNPIHLIDEGLNFSDHDKEYEKANEKFKEANNILKTYLNEFRFDQEKICKKIQFVKVHNYFLWGSKLKSTDDYEASIEKYDKALKCCPKELGLKDIDVIKAAKAESYILWGNKLKNNEKNYKLSVEKYDEALRIILNDQNTNIFKYKALDLCECEILHGSSKNFQGALDKLNNAIGLHSKESKYFSSKADVLNKIVMYDQAISAADKTLQLDCTSEMAKHEKCFALTKQAETLLLQDNPLLALHKYKAVLKIEPGNSDAIHKSFIARELVTAKCLQNKENKIYEDELTSYQFQDIINRQIQAINMLCQDDLKEGYEKAKMRFHDSRLYIYRCWAGSLLKKCHDFEGAIEKCDAALEINSNDQSIKNIKAEALNCWGIEIQKNKSPKYEVALEKFHQAIVLQPNNSTYQVNIASTQNKLEKYNEAIEAADKALQLNNCDDLAKDEKMYALNKQGDNLFYQKRFEDALNKYNDVLKIKPNCEAEKKKKAARSIIKGLNLQNEGDRLLNQAISSEQKQQDYEKAVKKYLEALQIFENVDEQSPHLCELDERFSNNKINIQEKIKDIKIALEGINKVIISFQNACENIQVMDKVISEDFQIPVVQEYHRQID